jgi:DivIVA domain-containing protein
MRSVPSMERSIAENVKDLETRGRYLRRRGFGGYRSEDVDALLTELMDAVRGLLAENEGLRAGLSPERLSSATSRRMTPLDVEDAGFRRARVGGYDMRSVDEYLDEVTELLAALTQENEALRRGSSELGREDVSR